jgi:hypothetical protein
VPRDASFAFVARDTSGWSPGFDVRSEDGTDWRVKLGPEAQSEVVSSRVLWAIGFHRPPTYFLERWALTGIESGPQPPGRFRPSLANRKVTGDWSWYENPFVGSRAFGGLIVANLILNSWDWKTSNNKIHGRPEFDYRGSYRDVIETVTSADVRWVCGLLNRLSDEQWRDAFRAGGYDPEQTGRYLTQI